MQTRPTVGNAGRPRVRRLPTVAALAVTVVFLVPSIVFAKSFIASGWTAKYPSSLSFDNASCQLCHGSSTSTYNGYGWALRTEYRSNGNDTAAAAAAIEGINSDGDLVAAKNIKEIDADTQPGWTYGANNDLYTSDGSVTHNNAPPAGITGSLDPVTEIGIGDNYFSPDSVKVKVGGGVHWSRISGATGSHNVAEVGGIFRSGDPTTGAIDLVEIFSAGKFRYKCDTHGLAQDGFVLVKPKTRSAPTGLPFTVLWATKRTTTGSMYDVQYRVGAGAWTNWMSDTTALKGVFGKNGSPVVPVAGTTYKFRVSSQEGAANSLWSPAKGFTP